MLIPDCNARFMLSHGLAEASRGSGWRRDALKLKAQRDARRTLSRSVRIVGAAVAADRGAELRPRGADIFGAMGRRRRHSLQHRAIRVGAAQLARRRAGWASGAGAQLVAF